MRLTARLGAVFGEPAGVAGVACLKKAIAQGIIRPDETAVAVITGNGLKDVQSAKQAAGLPITVDPDLAELKRVLKS